MIKQTLVVNLLGGPGTGKSSVRAGVFHDLKFKGINCEEATEFAKDLTWQKSQFSLQNQIHVFGEQHHRIWKLLGQVDVVITDSPLLLTPIYDSSNNSELTDLALKEFFKMKNLVFFLKRVKSYNPSGRNQTELEAKEIDQKILTFLNCFGIDYVEETGNASCKDRIVNLILKSI